ncbi:MAG: hypothetical protein WDA20_09310 [Desulfuromonadales bacterium]
MVSIGTKFRFYGGGSFLLTKPVVSAVHHLKVGAPAFSSFLDDDIHVTVERHQQHAELFQRKAIKLTFHDFRDQ